MIAVNPPFVHAPGKMTCRSAGTMLGFPSAGWFAGTPAGQCARYPHPLEALEIWRVVRQDPAVMADKSGAPQPACRPESSHTTDSTSAPGSAGR